MYEVLSDGKRKKAPGEMLVYVNSVSVRTEIFRLACQRRTDILAEDIRIPLPPILAQEARLAHRQYREMRELRAAVLEGTKVCFFGRKWKNKQPLTRFYAGPTFATRRNSRCSEPAEISLGGNPVQD